MFRQAVRKFSTEAASNAKINTVGMERFVPLTVAAEPCSVLPKRNVLTGKLEINGWPVVPTAFLGFLVFSWNEQRIQQKAGVDLAPFVAGTTWASALPFWVLYRYRSLEAVQPVFVRDVMRAYGNGPAVKTVGGNMAEIGAMVAAQGGEITPAQVEAAKERVDTVLSSAL